MKTLENINRTGNTIVVNVFVGSEIKEVPVTRNGKPTKRVKKEWVANYEERTLTGILVQGQHEIFIDENETTSNRNVRDKVYMAFKANGERLTVDCKYGNYGSKLHQSMAFYSLKYNDIVTMDYGWDGATGKGHGARIVKINW